MAITVRTIYPNLLYQLRITSVSDDVEIIRYTYATGLLTSDYIPASALAILQARWDLLNTGLSAGVVNNFAILLSNLLLVADSGGELAPFYSGGGVNNFLYLTGLNPAATYSINIGISHSESLWLIAAAATAPI